MDRRQLLWAAGLSWPAWIACYLFGEWSAREMADPNLTIFAFWATCAWTVLVYRISPGEPGLWEILMPKPTLAQLLRRHTAPAIAWGGVVVVATLGLTNLGDTLLLALKVLALGDVASYEQLRR